MPIAELVKVEPDGNGFLATIAELPLYGFGDSEADAVGMLRREIESLRRDLDEGLDGYSGDWRERHRFLASLVERDVD